MIHAIVDAEDAQFYEHGGLSYWGMLRAVLDDLKPGAHLQGASTLTQQLVRNLILKTRRAHGEAQGPGADPRAAHRGALSKDEILYLYLNQIEFPYQRFGVEEAARFYFGKSIARGRRRRGGAAGVAAQGAERDRSVEAPRARQGSAELRAVADGALQPLDASRGGEFARAPIRVVRTPAPFARHRARVRRRGARRCSSSAYGAEAAGDASARR